MTAPEHDGFLSRWSRRKSQARAGTEQDGAPVSDARADVVAPGPAGAAVPAPHADPAAPSDTDTPPEPPALTLDDVRALTSDSDFAPFVARHVAPDVKNAALKKLFSDPHYNIMDGLDTYIDDYSNMTPLPAPMLRRLASARALAMFDTAGEPAAPDSASGSAPGSGSGPGPDAGSGPAVDPGADSDSDPSPDSDPGPAGPGRQS